MSKQKCRISKKRSNFSIVSNEIAQGLNYDLAALGLYVYLFSLPHDWEFHKSHLRKVCNIGEKKLNNLLRTLAQHRLVKIAQIRKENGQFSHFDIQVDDGTSFLINKLEETAQPDVQNCRPAENGGAVKQSYKEYIYKEDIKTNKDKNICATENVAQTRFNDFWSVYPKKKDRMRAEAIWRRSKLDGKADKIIQDVKARLANDSTWKDNKYIPHPSNYLKFERWSDEVTLVSVQNTNKFDPIGYALQRREKRLHQGNKL